VIVSRDNTKFVDAVDIAPTLQAALDNWAHTFPALQQRYEQLNKFVNFREFSPIRFRFVSACTKATAERLTALWDK
jgi:hypothetical protein